jgi:hypothetical protein
MNDQNDHFARWFQAFSAVPLLAIAAFDLHMTIFGRGISYVAGRHVRGSDASYLAYRCLYYAITGRKNINRDDF